MEANSKNAKRKRWSKKTRILIYTGATMVAVLIGFCFTGIWFFNEFRRIQEFNQYALREKVCDQGPNSKLKLLFVGNSLLFCSSMPFQFAGIYRQGQTNKNQGLKIYQVVRPGETLGLHLEQGRFERVLKENGPFDFVIIQAASYEATYHPETMRENLAIMIEKVRKTGSEPILLMTWADKGDYKTQKAVSDFLKSMGKEFNARVLADGDLFFEAQKDYPSMEIYMKDRHHQNDTGSYLGALLTYARLTGDSIDRAPSSISIPEGKELSLVRLSPVEHANCIRLVNKFLKSRSF